MLDAQKIGITADQTTEPIQKLYMENTLLRISGALFCHDAKRASMRTQEIVLNRGAVEKNIIVRPDPRLGQPGPLAHKVFVALLKKHSDYGRPIRGEVHFTRKEIGRLIGRKEWGGSDSRDLHRALFEIYYTHIIAHFKNQAGCFVEQPFKIFSNILIEREQSADDPIVSCSVSIDPHIVSSLRNEHFTCLNHGVMQQVGTIGQAVYMRLFFHFANLYDGHHRTRLSFPKRYDDICAEWLGGLTVLKFRSKIEQEQLGPHLRRLVQLGFLASYSITKSARGDGLVITFRPGATFFADYDRFYRGRNESEIQFEFRNDQVTTEPLKVAYLFIEKRTSQPVKDIPYVSSKEVETAKHLLKQVPFEEVSDFLDYALSEAKKTRFDVQSLGGLKQYVAGYRQTCTRRAAAKTAEKAHQAREGEEADRVAYDRYRRAQADELFEALPAEEREIIERLARTNNRSFMAGDGSLASTMYVLARARTTVERHPNHIKSFESWRKSFRAA